MRRSGLPATLPIVLALLTGCGSGAVQQGASEADLNDALVERADMNADGRPDLSRYFAPGAAEGQKKLLRLEIDLNFDGRVDKINTYNPETGKLAKVELNWDFDKGIDMVETYDAEGNLEEQSIDRDFNGEFDVLKHYKGGLPYSRQIDTNNDGRWDIWEYFTKKGDVYRIGKDQDGDGKPEYFEDVKKK